MQSNQELPCLAERINVMKQVHEKGTLPVSSDAGAIHLSLLHPSLLSSHVLSFPLPASTHAITPPCLLQAEQSMSQSLKAPCSIGHEFCF